MDPNATLALLLDAISEGDIAAASEHSEDLACWLEKGGFVPLVSADDTIRLLTAPAFIFRACFGDNHTDTLETV